MNLKMSLKKFTQSLNIDKRLFEADIRNTSAHNLTSLMLGYFKNFAFLKSPRSCPEI